MKNYLHSLAPLLLVGGMVGIVGCSQGPQKSPQSGETGTDYQPVQQAPNKETSSATPQSPPSHSLKSSSTPTMNVDPADQAHSEQPVTQGDYNALSSAEARVILDKGTDYPGDGGYTLTSDPGSYICRQCNALLYRAEDKFESHCGWPSFDDEVEGAVTSLPDADGRRVEIVCANCDGHLGHVFTGERLTPKNTRHCVNTSSMTFIAQGKPLPAKIVKP